uniref:Uncharacterized protein n=1 Tax=viral metagenome TaxID=1070528 RepID=A0A6C0CPF6_9ZZZZ
MSYQPKKPFFTMSIPELKEYVNHCKNIELKKKKQKLKQKAGRKTRSKRLRKTRKKRRKYSRRKKKT